MNGAGRPASRGMLSPMTTPPFDALLSTRARYAVPLTTPRQSMSPLFEFGGGYPDPVSFPYEGMIEATAKMMAAEGAQAMTYGDPQGYIGLRELICHKYQLFEMMKTRPENIVVANGSGQALSLAFSAFVDPGDAIIIEAPTFSGSLNTRMTRGSSPTQYGSDSRRCGARAAAASSSTRS